MTTLLADFFLRMNNVIVFFPIELNVSDSNSTIEIISKFSNNIFLVHMLYNSLFESIELGTIIPATSSDFNSCFVLSKKNSSILLLVSNLSIKLLNLYKSCCSLGSVSKNP